MTGNFLHIKSSERLKEAKKNIDISHNNELASFANDVCMSVDWIMIVTDFFIKKKRKKRKNYQQIKTVGQQIGKRKKKIFFTLTINVWV